MYIHQSDYASTAHQVISVMPWPLKCQKARLQGFHHICTYSHREQPIRACPMPQAPTCSKTQLERITQIGQYLAKIWTRV